jgi:hypothetical protein
MRTHSIVREHILEEVADIEVCTRVKRDPLYMQMRPSIHAKETHYSAGITGVCGSIKRDLR